MTRAHRSGVIADLGVEGPVIALRADMDALPVQDLTDDPWRSSVTGVAHACGHDVHTAALVGAGLALAEVASRGLLPGRVRLLFQPAEEVMPGGAVQLLDEGALDTVDRIFALHCDPGVDVGQVGLRLGPLTSAADRVEVRLTGTGGHTSRPHLTGDLTFALAKVTTELPAVLSRRPRRTECGTRCGRRRSWCCRVPAEDRREGGAPPDRYADPRGERMWAAVWRVVSERDAGELGHR